MSGTLLKKKDLLTLIPVSKSTFRRWLKNGSFPQGKKHGRIILWSQDQIDVWWQTVKQSEDLLI